MTLPPIVQGGMGFAVSGWPLAAAVSREGQFGVVSGTGVALSFAARLHKGDPGGLLHEALRGLPDRALVDRVLKRWYIDGSVADRPERPSIPMPSWPMDPELVELTIAATYAEVALAKAKGGEGPIGLNLLAKVEIMTLPALYGAMLAGVDAVFMGAGIPRFVPGVLDAFAAGGHATLPLTVSGGSQEMMDFYPTRYLANAPRELPRPAFFPIISSESLAKILLRKSDGKIDGFIVENYTAGGHNAPPRESVPANSRGEPVWGDQDRPSLGAFRAFGLPFYIAGGFDDSISLRAAKAQGATGIQIGTPFAFCDESGLLPELKAAVIRAALRGDIDVLTDPRASPTGFPFKVVQLAKSLSDAHVYAGRKRSCEWGYLRTASRRGDGALSWRCPAEREDAFISKGGTAEEAGDRKCLCAGLIAAVGQASAGEPYIVTAGDSLRHLTRHLRAGQDRYTAADVINSVMR